MAKIDKDIYIIAINRQITTHIGAYGDPLTILSNCYEVVYYMTPADEHSRPTNSSMWLHYTGDLSFDVAKQLVNQQLTDADAFKYY